MSNGIEESFSISAKHVPMNISDEEISSFIEAVSGSFRDGLYRIIRNLKARDNEE